MSIDVHTMHYLYIIYYRKLDYEIDDTKKKNENEKLIRKWCHLSHCKTFDTFEFSDFKSL